MTWRRVASVVAIGLSLIGGVGPTAARAPAPDVAAAVQTLTRDSRWTQVSATPLNFDAYHPQGMVKIGEAFFVSSVEILERTRFYPERRGGFDRDQGKGQGWLFKLNARGELLGQLKLGEGAMYHAGGLDFDGRYLWVPVAEYRPGGRTILYRVDPRTMTAVQALRVDDHIGALARDPGGRALVGVSWGGRRLYAWSVDREGRVHGPARAVANRSHYIDYQDCHGVGMGRMLCTGVAYYRPARDRPPLALGGVDLIDITTLRPIWQAPVQAWTPAGAAMTSNAAVFQATETGLRGYFIPEDGRSALYSYDVSAAGR